MGLLADVWDWFGTPATWTGEGIDPGILVRLYEHMTMSLQATALAAALVLPLGLYIGHRRRFEFLAISVGNLGRALPSFGILGMAFILTGSWPGTIGFWAAFITLCLLAVPPILISTYVGVKQVDPDTIESSRGMGMTEWQILARIEIPLAAPYIVTGLRLATVQVIATTTLAAVVAWGGLGRYIVDGFQSGNDVELLGGAILIAIVAIAAELAFGFLQRAVAPRLSSRPERRTDPLAPGTA